MGNKYFTKYTDDQVLAVLKLRLQGYSLKEVGAQLGIPHTSIDHLTKRGVALVKKRNIRIVTR